MKPIDLPCGCYKVDLQALTYIPPGTSERSGSMISPADDKAAWLEGLHAAKLGYPWDSNPFLHPIDLQMRIRWHFGWWAGKRPDLYPQTLQYETERTSEE